MEKNFDSENIISRLNQLSKEKGVSLNKVLCDCGFKNFVINIRNGSIPSVDKFLKIADYFDVSLDWLLTGEGEQTKPPQSAPIPPARTNAQRA
jgi:transcriptional regulator with XRE-family HTH domain